MFVFLFLAALHQVADLVEPVGQMVLAAALDAFVRPVGGVALLRDVVHPLGADLHLHGQPLLRLHGGMERFVAVVTRLRDPVAQALGIGCIFFRHQGIDLPAEGLLHGVDRLAVDDEAHREQVVHLIEGDLLGLHLLPDGIGALRARFQRVAYALLVELFPQRIDEALHQSLALWRGVLDPLRFGILEEDVFQFGFDVVEAELMGEGDVKHHRLHQFLGPLGRGQHTDIAHHLEAVGQLDQDHARIGGVGDDELAVAFFIQIGLLQLDVGDVVESLHDLDDVVGVFCAERFQERCVVEFVRPVGLEAVGFVEQGGGHCIGAQADFLADDVGDGHGMFDEGVAVAAHLSLQGLFGRFVGRDDHLLLAVRESAQDILYLSG